MFAASKVRIDSFERLLKDPRVDINLKTNDSEDALDLLPPHTSQFQRRKMEKFFEDAIRERSNKETQKRKVAIIIANSNYEQSSNLPSLPGAKEDLEKLTAFLLEKTYHIITIVNAQDIEAKVTEVMKGLPDSYLPVTHFQLVYSGIST